MTDRHPPPCCARPSHPVRDPRVTTASRDLRLWSIVVACPCPEALSHAGAGLDHAVVAGGETLRFGDERMPSSVGTKVDASVTTPGLTGVPAARETRYQQREKLGGRARHVLVALVAGRDRPRTDPIACRLDIAVVGKELGRRRVASKDAVREPCLSTNSKHARAADRSSYTMSSMSPRYPAAQAAVSRSSEAIAARYAASSSRSRPGCMDSRRPR